jgi:hypothetical protein
MMDRANEATHRISCVVELLLTIVMALAAAPDTESGTSDADVVTLTGRVVLLADALKGFPLRADAGPIEGQVVLISTDTPHQIVPLLSDEGSRALFLDERLRDRPVRLFARRYDGLPYLQVTRFEVEHEGRHRTPEYWCDVCSISHRYPQVCACCQGDLELRMKPDR